MFKRYSPMLTIIEFITGRIFLRRLAGVLLGVLLISDLASQTNYVKERVILRQGITSKSAADQVPVGIASRQTTKFVDGLGRPLQEVSSSLVSDGSGGFADLITPHVYDAAGREAKSYLPFAASGNNGAYYSGALTAQSSFYNGLLPGEQNFYSEKLFENSPLNRELKNSPQGKRWVGASTGKTRSFLVNTSADNVYKWKLTLSSQFGLNVVVVVNRFNGTQSVTYSFPKMKNATTSVMRYRLKGAALWTTSGGAPISPRVVEIPSGDYEYGMEFYFSGGAPSIILPFQPAYATSAVASDGAYEAGQLFKEITVDESGRKVVHYTDLDGKLLLKKVQRNAAAGEGHADWLCTYYIYDDLGRLRFVMLPKATDAFLNGKTFSQFQEQLCFRYEYDNKNQMVVKKVPGAAEEWFVYDSKGRLSLSQDGLLRKAQKWRYFQYDGLGRELSNGLVSDPDNYDKLGIHAQWANVSSSYPNASSYTSELLRQTFYDDYSFGTAGVGQGFDGTYAANNAYFTTSSGVAPEFADQLAVSSVTKGFVTGHRIAVVGVSGQFLLKAYYYDNRGRIIQTQSGNLTGGVDIKTDQFNFSGQILNSLTQHTYAGTTGQQKFLLGQKRVYDLAGKLSSTAMTVARIINGSVANSVTKQLAANTYDGLGRLSQKVLGSNTESLTYDYNIRGWLTGINRKYVSGAAAGHYFGEEIAYDDPTTVAAGTAYTTPQLNGNIGGVTWKSKGDGIRRKYDYTYDLANRLTNAAFLQNPSGTTWNANMVDFSVTGVQYDANGNIKNMTQKGYALGSSPVIDKLTYTYENDDLSNRLRQVHDDANNANSRLGDFRYAGTKTIGGSTDYVFDESGNMISDINKGIGAIQYAPENKQPLNFAVTNKGSVQYIYDADGVKLRKNVLETNGTISSTTDYIGDFVYQTVKRSPVSAADPVEALQFITTDEGRIRPVTGGTTSFVFDYYLKDHLGNNRVVVTDEIKQVMDIPAATFEKGGSGSLPQYYKVSNYGNITANNAIPSFAGNAGNSYVNNNGVTNPETDATLNTGAQSGAMYKIQKAAASPADVGLTIKVTAGDMVSLWGKSYYFSNNVTSNNSNLVKNVVTGFVNAFTGTPALAASQHAAGAATALSTQGNPLNTSLLSALNTLQYSNGTSPRAGINWILFDDQLNAVASNSGAIDVGQQTSGSVGHWSRSVSISQSGYLYVFCSNESSNIDVYFDNIQLVVNASQMLEETHYYPFGLTMTGISSKAASRLQNKFRYNGKELQSAEFSDGNGLELYDFGVRMQDPQLGRWWAPDPVAEKTFDMSPYVYANNNPVLMIDQIGQYAVSVHYNITYNALRGLGYSKKDADLIAHYASVYADHPENKARFYDFMGHPFDINPHPYRKSIDYSPTAASQDESNSRWHSMMSDAEAEAGMTEQEAMLRGLEFGWKSIFESDGGKNIGKLGQGLHALQDAYAHKGAKTNDHLGKNSSSVFMLMNDMWGSTREASEITRSALIVLEVLQGKKSNLKDGDHLNLYGMPQGLLIVFLYALYNQGFRGHVNSQ